MAVRKCTTVQVLGMRHAVCSVRPPVRNTGPELPSVTKTGENSFVLVVDRAKETVQAVIRSLTDAGWTAAGTSDPWEAIHLLTELPLHLILLGRDLPGMGGTDLCALIQNDPALCQIPVIFMDPGGLPSSLAQSEGRRPSSWPFPPEEPAGGVGGKAETRFIRRQRTPLTPIPLA